LKVARKRYLLGKDKVEIYLLDVKAPKTDAKRFECTDVLTVGSDSACDIILKDFGLSPLHGRFRFQNGVLTFTNLGLDDSCKIGSQKCGQGRMYILDKGDKFVCGDVKIIIRKEKVEVKEEVKQDTPIKAEPSDVASDETTDPSAPLGDFQDEEEEYEEVEVYVDEDGNEVEAPKKLGFFARMKEKRQLKKEEKRKAKEAKEALKTPPKGLGKGHLKSPSKPPLLKSKNRLKEPTAGIISRFLGLLFDLVFFFIILKMAFPFIAENFEFDILTEIAPHTQPLVPLLTKSLSYLEAIPQIAFVFKDYPEIRETILNKELIDHLAAFLAYDIVFNLILGVGLGSFLVGLKAGGSFLLVRLLSPIRVLIGWLTLPLLILDFPILLKKASFKEFITMTRVLNRSLLLNLTSSFIFLPIIIIAIGNMSILPLLVNLPAPTPSSDITLAKNEGSFKEVEFYLRSYGLKKEGKTFLNPKLELIPTLPKTKIPRTSSLTVYNPNKSERITIVPELPLIPLEDIIALLKKDPFFTIRNEQLISRFEASNEKLKDKQKSRPKKGKEMILQKEETQVLIKFLYEIISIDFTDPMKALMELGPFLAPYHELQEAVLKKLGIIQIKKATLIKNSQTTYLKLIPVANPREFFLVGAGTQGLTYYRVNSNKQGKALGKKVVERLIMHPRAFKKDYTKLMKELKKDKVSLNKGFMAHAILIRACEKQKLSPKEITFFTKYFMTMAQKATKTENESFQERLIESLQNMDKGLLKLKRRNKDDGLAKLRLGLLRIQKALSDKDFKFFRANR
jgi:hypothetical protein